MSGGRFDEWARWLIGGAIAGLVAYATMRAEVDSLKATLALAHQEGREDRAELVAAVDELRQQLTDVTIELRQEEVRRGLVMPSKVGSFQAHTRFDK
jgi:hypothetical protein